MSKRFTATEKWDKPWYRKLPPRLKCLWQFLCDRCDQAGVIEMDWDLASFQIGEDAQESDLRHFEGRIRVLPSGKILILSFVNYQYGKLSMDCRPHAPVFAAIGKHGLKPEDFEQNESYKNTVDPNVRLKIINRDQSKCVYTGVELQDAEIEIDHVIPRSLGGSNKPTNLVTTSKEVNRLKRDMPLEAFCEKQGWDKSLVLQRLSKAFGLPLKAFQRLQEEEKEIDKEKEEVPETETESPKPVPPAGSFPTLEQVLAFADKLMILPHEAKAYWLARDGVGWVRSSNGASVPVRNWQSDMQSYVNGQRQREAEAKAQQAKKPKQRLVC